MSDLGSGPDDDSVSLLQVCGHLSQSVTMFCPLLTCFLLGVVFGGSKPTERKTSVHEEEPLSNLEHDDEKNYDYDHEAFLGHDEAQVFEQLPPAESKRRLR